MNKKEKQDASQRDKKVKRVKTHHANVDCFQLEEAESANLRTKQCFLSFLDTCNKLQEVFHAVYLAKKAKKSEFDYKIYIMDANSLVMRLKKLNRLDKHNCKRSRDAVSERKQKVEALNLQFQNLQYEVTHLQKEVTKCLEFRSQDEDIELVPVEEFYKEAPPSISKPEITKADNHELTLARLQWELEQRKRLSTKSKQAEVSRESCKQSIRKLKEILLSIHPTLQNIIQATEPLQTKLGMPLQEVHFKHRIAKFLPKPLYTLYVEACAYREACDKKIDISIEGSIDDARVLQLKLDDILDDSGESDQEEMPNPKRHRHSVSVRPEDSHKDVLNKHPLSVHLAVEGNGGKICMEFCYLYRLSIVTVSVKSVTSKSGVMADKFLLDPKTVLNCLFPEDTGLFSPNPANKYLLKKLENEDVPFSNDETGLPFMWAQRVSGLQFISCGSSQEDEADNGMEDSYMESVISAIRFRLIARLSLVQDISTLVSGSAIPSYIAEITDASNIKSKLKKWCAASWSEVMNHPSYNRLLELNIITKYAYVYQAFIERGSACLTSLVLIPPDYPTRSPVLLLSLQHKVNSTEATSYALRELEEEINIHAVEEIRLKQEEDMGDSSDMLLLYQVYHLLVCFDVFLETEFCADSVEGPQEFMQDKVHTKLYRGRSHSRPYKYLASKGIFTHR